MQHSIAHRPGQHWPSAVPPVGTPQWRQHATTWLFDHCPADYRKYPVLGRNPLALAHLTRFHVIAQLRAMDEARSLLRHRLTGHLAPPAVEEAMYVVGVEQGRLRAVLDGIDAVGYALSRAQPGP